MNSDEDKRRLHDWAAALSEDKRRMARELNPDVMLDDPRRLAALAEDLARRPGLWRTALVSWNARSQADGGLELDGLFTLESEDQGCFAVFVQPLMRAQPHTLLFGIVAALCNAVTPEWMARVVDPRIRGVRVSRFAQSFPHDAPVLAQFARDHVERRFCAYMRAHPQLEAGQSLIKSFSDQTTFVTNGRFLAALLSSPTAMSVEFFEMEDDSAAVVQPQFIDLPDFRDFSQALLAQARDGFFAAQNA
jgi:hypothetical protein